MTTEENVKSCTSEQLEAVLAGLSPDQLRYVVARQDFTSNREAAESIGVAPRTVYSWGDDVREAVRLMALDGLVTAQHIRRRNLAKAMLVKVKGLDSDEENVRQKAATEIIEWELGRATQRNELSGTAGEPLRIEYVNDWRSSDADKTA